jgi:glycosyltransferase involved in cell wall biosynthesis
VNILHVTPYYAPAYAFGGVVRAVEGLSRALSAAGHSVTVLTTDALAPGERLRGAEDVVEAGVRIIRVPNSLPRGTLNLSSPSGMMRQAARALVQGADVVHCHEFRTVENLLVAPLATRLGKPLLLSPHGTLTYAAGRGLVKAAWDALLSPGLARRFACVVGLTEAEKDEVMQFWRRFGGAARFAVIPNGVDPAEFADLKGGAAFRAQYGLGDAPVVLFLGRLHPRKGAHLLAAAFCAANIPGARLVIAGPDEGGLALLTPYRDDARIIVTGYLDAQQRLAALAAADVFALTAVGEGLSMAALEALAAGVPTLLSPECHLPEAAAAGAGLEAARTVEPLAAALAALLTDPAKRAQMGAAARALVAERFTWAKVAAAWGAVYATIG